MVLLLAVVGLRGDSVTAQSCFAPEQAVNHVGEIACVAGTVTTATYASRSNGQPTFLDFGPNFTAVIWGDDRPLFNPPPETLRGKRVEVRGEITSFRGKAQIIVYDPSQLGAPGSTTAPPPRATATNAALPRQATSTATARPALTPTLVRTAPAIPSRTPAPPSATVAAAPPPEGDPEVEATPSAEATATPMAATSPALTTTPAPAAPVAPPTAANSAAPTPSPTAAVFSATPAPGTVAAEQARALPSPDRGALPAPASVVPQPAAVPATSPATDRTTVALATAGIVLIAVGAAGGLWAKAKGK